MSWFEDAYEEYVKPHVDRFQEFSDNFATSVNSYSDFVQQANGYTNGWYGTFASSLPFLGNIHRTVLDRDRTNDMLRNSGQSWWDVLGYNSSNLTSGASSALAGVNKKVLSKMEDGVHDLFEYYTGEQDSINKGFDKYKDFR